MATRLASTPFRASFSRFVEIVFIAVDRIKALHFTIIGMGDFTSSAKILPKSRNDDIREQLMFIWMGMQA